MPKSLRLNTKNVESFCQKLLGFSFELKNTNDPLAIARKEADPYIRRVFGRMNAAFREQLATTAQRPDLQHFFGHVRTTARPDATTYETGGLFNSLRYEIDYKTRGRSRRATLRVYSTSPAFDIADDPSKRSRITLPRVREWLSTKFGISTGTAPATKVSFNPRGAQKPLRYDQLVFGVYGAIIQGQRLKRYRSQRLRSVLVGEFGTSRGNSEVSAIKDRIAKRLLPLDKLDHI